MRKLVTSVAATVLAAVLMTQLTAASEASAIKPQDRWMDPALVGYMAYEWYEYHYGDNEATVTTSEDFHLQDGTYIGSSGGNWQGPQQNSNDLAQAITTGAVGQVGTWAGHAMGTVVGTWASGVIASGGSTAAMNWAGVVLFAGPYAGALVGLGVGLA